MPSIVVPADFVGEYLVPSATDANVSSKLQLLINKYEEYILNEVLGYTLAKQYREGIAAEAPDTKWSDLKNGKEFSLCGRVVKWNGLKSLLLPYTYYKWLVDGATQTSGFGQIVAVPNQAILVSPEEKQIRMYNEFIQSVRVLLNFIYVNDSDYNMSNLDYVFSVNNYTKKMNTFSI